MKNSIVLKSLELAGFQNPTAIAKILNYVPNASVALEMLLGIHTPQELDENNRFRKYKWDSNKIVEITSIDELGNRISYTKYEQNTQTVYYITKEDQNNKVYQLERPSSDRNYYNNGSIPANGYSKSENNSMDLADFENSYGTIVSVADAASKFEEWINYGVIIEKDPTDLYNAELIAH